MRPSSPCLHNHKYTPSSKAADVARLLDPSYSSSSSTSYTTTTSVYVDHDGEVHDPDYREFPPLSPKRGTKKLNSAAARRNTAMSNRPQWEKGYNSDDAISDEEEDEDASYDHHSRVSSHNTLYSSHGYARRPSHSTASYATYRTPHYSSSEPSPPTSLESDHHFFLEDDFGVSSFLEEEKTTKATLKKQRRLSKDRRASNATQPVIEEELDPHASTSYRLSPLSQTVSLPAPETPHQRVTSFNSTAHLEEEEVEKPVEWTPTCEQVMRRQWQAVSMRVRFGIFRAQRRIRERLTGG